MIGARDEEKPGTTASDLEELKLLGIKTDNVKQSEIDRSEIEIFGVNRDAIQVFAVCHPTQWTISSSGLATGLNWQSVKLTAETLGLEWSISLLLKIKQCEVIALNYWREIYERSKPQAGFNG